MDRLEKLEAQDPQDQSHNSDHGNEKLWTRFTFPTISGMCKIPLCVHFSGYPIGNNHRRDDYVEHFASKVKLEATNFYAKLESNAILDWITWMTSLSGTICLEICGFIHHI